VAVHWGPFFHSAHQLVSLGELTFAERKVSVFGRFNPSPLKLRVLGNVDLTFSGGLSQTISGPKIHDRVSILILLAANMFLCTTITLLQWL
jgi:hypothetical protein